MTYKVVHELFMNLGMNCSKNRPDFAARPARSPGMLPTLIVSKNPLLFNRNSVLNCKLFKAFRPVIDIIIIISNFARLVHG